MTKEVGDMKSLPNGYIDVAGVGLPLNAVKLFTSDETRFHRRVEQAAHIVKCSQLGVDAIAEDMPGEEIVEVMETVGEVKAILECLMHDMHEMIAGGEQSGVDWWFSAAILQSEGRRHQ